MNNPATYSFNGIYAIRFDGCDSVYIGATSCSFGERTLSHLYHLRSGTHANKKLQDLYLRFGESALKVYILDVGYSTKYSLIRAEKQWAKKVSGVLTLLNKIVGGRLRFRKNSKPFRYEGTLPIYVGKHRGLREKLTSLGVVASCP